MNLDKGTLTRTIVLIVALINQILAMFGKSPIPFDDVQVTEIISTCITIAAAMAAWWKNNDFTPEARKGSEVMKRAKAEKTLEKLEGKIRDGKGMM